MINQIKKSENAWAKINLHLAVLEKQADGFHNIESIFAPVSLCDKLRCEISISKNIKDFSVIVNWLNNHGANIPLETNLIYKAAKLFFEKTKLSFSLAVDIEKNIPSGAGLGGASSDAAVIIKVLNEAFGAVFSAPELTALAAEIGSDVPFFLENKPAFVHGRGEKIELIPFKLNYKIALIKPFFDSITKEAYFLLDEKRKNKAREKSIIEKKELTAALEKPAELWPFYNDFEAVFFSRDYCYAGEYKNTIELLKQNGALWTALSGSGSSVFGLFPENAALNLENKNFNGVLFELFFV